MYSKGNHHVVASQQLRGTQQAAADCAQVLGVSTDWLLGLTDRPAPPDRIAEEAVTLAPAARAVLHLLQTPEAVPSSWTKAHSE